METRKIHYKSDFDCILRLKDCRGEEVGWPGFDWEARFWTWNKSNVFVASRRGDVLTNCFEDNGRIHVVFDNHRLSPGTLTVEFSAMLPNDTYPDGDERVVSPVPLGIELVRGSAPCPSAIEAELMLPYIKGERGETGPQGPKGDKGAPFTYGDFTPGQLEELRRPATEAAARADKVTATLSQAAEKADKAAEKAEEVADTYSGELACKADRTELSNVLAVEPLTPGNFPEIETLTRGEIKEDLFIDLWDEACKTRERNGAVKAHGRYDPSLGDKPYLLNKMWFSYDEAVGIYIAGRIQTCAASRFYCQADIRTNLPPSVGAAGGSNPGNLQADCLVGHTRMEVLNLSPNGEDIKYTISSNTSKMFHESYSLREVIGPVSMYCATAASQTGMFNGAPNLEEIRIMQLRSNLILSALSKLSLASVEYLVKWAANTATITVTLHPAVYALLTGEDDGWQAVLEAAAAKNIVFTTTD